MFRAFFYLRAESEVSNFTDKLSSVEVDCAQKAFFIFRAVELWIVWKVDQDVGKFQVSMDDALSPEVFAAIENLF